MENLVSQSIIELFFQKLQKNVSVDVAIVGGGPSALVASYYLRKAGYSVAIFERKLSPGGGMWGGAMLFTEIVVQEEARPILDEFKIKYHPFKNQLYTVDSIHATSALIYNATAEGVVIFTNTSVEDVVFKNGRVSGVVLNWSPVHRLQLHVDPLVILSQVVVDATGHECDVARTLEKKNNVMLNTETGKVVGEKSLSIEEAERATIENTKEIYPGLYVCGMAANGVSGGFRMGPIFGGMLLSGKKVATLIKEKLK